MTSWHALVSGDTTFGPPVCPCAIRHVGEWAVTPAMPRPRSAAIAAAAGRVRTGLAVPGPAGMTGPAQPIRALRLRVPRRTQAAFPAAAGAHRPGFPAPAWHQPPATILFMPAS